MSESESQPKKRFPLTLDFVTGLSGRSKTSTQRTHSTQTATRNATERTPNVRPVPVPAVATKPQRPSNVVDTTSDVPLVSEAVPYTHLTLPPKQAVIHSGVAVSLNKNET